MGLVAAATDRGEVKVWDGWTGREKVWGREKYEEGGERGWVEETGGENGVKGHQRTEEKNQKGKGHGEVGNLVRSLFFTGGGEEGRKGESLLVARGAVVEVWGL